MSDPFALPAGDLAPLTAEFEGDLAAFARVVDVQGGQLAWIVGAGASAMSGIPTAEALVLQFKHTLYCGLNNLGIQDVDPADRRTRELIERYFEDRSGFPPKGDPEEYSVIFEEAYPSPDLRADVIAKLCHGRTPNFGHYVLGALMTTGQLRLVFTPNFDDLLEAAATSIVEIAAITPRPSIVVATLGDPGRAERALQKQSWPLVAKLHGDFRDIRLKNTRSELATQDAEMRRVLRSACGRFGLVVCGYSGRDVSVMDALQEALTDEGSYPNGIFWCYRSIDTPGQAVLDFLHA
ncbi:MAG: SIR2 family protein, partial [Candidatus Dormibacteria bacterium]